jgi:hypothetical protein
VKIERKVIKEVNSPIKVGDLEIWKRRPPATKKKATPQYPPKMMVTPIIESDSEIASVRASIRTRKTLPYPRSDPVAPIPAAIATTRG